MNKSVPMLLAAMFCAAASAQVATTLRESGQVASQTAQQVGEEVKAAVEPQPHRGIDRSKARLHQAQARHHARKARDAARIAFDRAKKAWK